MGYEDEWTTYKSFGFKSMPLCCKRILHLLHINYIAVMVCPRVTAYICVSEANPLFIKIILEDDICYTPSIDIYILVLQCLR